MKTKNDLQNQDYFMSLRPHWLLELKSERIEAVFLGLPADESDEVLNLRAQAQKQDFELLQNLAEYFKGNNPKFRAKDFAIGLGGFRIADRSDQGALIDIALRAKVAEKEGERPSPTVDRKERKESKKMESNERQR